MMFVVVVVLVVALVLALDMVVMVKVWMVDVRGVLMVVMVFVVL